MPTNPTAARYGPSWRLYGDFPLQLRQAFLARAAAYGGPVNYLAYLLSLDSTNTEDQSQ